MYSKMPWARWDSLRNTVLLNCINDSSKQTKSFDPPECHSKTLHFEPNLKLQKYFLFRGNTMLTLQRLWNNRLCWPLPLLYQLTIHFCLKSSLWSYEITSALYLMSKQQRNFSLVTADTYCESFNKWNSYRILHEWLQYW